MCNHFQQNILRGILRIFKCAGSSPVIRIKQREAEHEWLMFRAVLRRQRKAVNPFTNYSIMSVDMILELVNARPKKKKFFSLIFHRAVIINLNLPASLGAGR